MRGLSAPVAIVVATALAVSWKPLVKSKASAVAMTTMITMVMFICPSSGPGAGRKLGIVGERKVNNRADPGSTG